MEFKQAVVTQNGRALMAKLLAGKSTQFTKIKVSSTVYPDAQLANLTALTNIKQEATAQAYGNNTATVSVVGAIENTGLTTGYYINTVGLYAVDPDKGEILYSVSSASKNGYMPPDTGVSKSGLEFKIYTEVGNATKVDLTVDPAAFATHEDLERFKADYYDRSETDELFLEIANGKEVSSNLLADFVGKIIGNNVENPHKAQWNFFEDLLTPVNPQISLSEFTQEQYDTVSQNNGVVKSYLQSNSGKASQIIFSWDVVGDISRRYPSLFANLGITKLADKVSFLKDRIVSNSILWEVYGRGSGPSGPNLTIKRWLPTKNSYESGGVSSTVNSISPIRSTSANGLDYIGSDGFSHIIAHAEESNGVTNSVIVIDYVSLTYTLKLKMSDFHVPRAEYNQEIGEIKDWIQAHS